VSADDRWYILVRFPDGTVARSKLMSRSQAHRWAERLDARGVEADPCEATIPLVQVAGYRRCAC